MFGALAGIAGAVALFVVAGTFALAIAQRRRETAVLRALGATPRQVRRLIAAEALIVSVLATALGLAAGAPLAGALVDLLAGHGTVPRGFAPVASWIPLAGAFALGIGIAQVAVVAAARRAGRTAPAEALREAAIEHGRPGVLQLLAGVLCLAGGATMSLVFSGFWAQAFACSAGCCSRRASASSGACCSVCPLPCCRGRCGRSARPGLLASTGLAANRWRTAAIATPVVLIAMLAGTQGLVQHSDQRDTERTTAERVTADHVVRGRDGGPLPAGTAARLAALDGVRGVAEVVPTEVYGLDHGLGEESPWRAAGLGAAGARTLDLGVVAGDLRAVRGDAIGVSRVVAHDGGLAVGDTISVRLADTAQRSLRVAAIYDRAAGLGDVVLDAAVARRHTVDPSAATVFVAGAAAGRSLAAYAAGPGDVAVADRAGYLDTVHAANQEDAWGVWLIIALTALFAALALVNTTAMATGERGGELATIRLLGGTPGQVVRMLALEMAATIGVALAAGAAVVWVAVAGVPRGLTGIPLELPGGLAGGLVAGVAGARAGGDGGRGPHRAARHAVGGDADARVSRARPGPRGSVRGRAPQRVHHGDRGRARAVARPDGGEQRAAVVPLRHAPDRHALVPLGPAQRRDHRHGPSRRDHVEQQAEVVQAVRHVGLEAGGAADPGHHVGVARPGAPARPVGVAQRGERDRPAAGGGRVVARQRQQQLVRLELHAVQPRQARPRGVLVLLGDGHVEPAAGEQRQRLLRLDLGQLHPHARVRGGEPLQRGHGERLRGGLEGGDAHRAAHVRGLRGQLGLDLLEPGQQLVGARGERASRVGQLEPPADLAEQRHARLPLELRKLLGDGGRREGERLGGRRDRAAARELAQHGQAAR